MNVERLLELHRDHRYVPNSVRWRTSRRWVHRNKLNQRRYAYRTEDGEPPCSLCQAKPSLSITRAIKVSIHDAYQQIRPCSKGDGTIVKHSQHLVSVPHTLCHGI